MDDLSSLTREEVEAQVRFWRRQSLLLASDFAVTREQLDDHGVELASIRAQLLHYAEDLNREYQLERRRAQEVEGLLVAAVGTLANAIEARDPYTRGHTGRVSRLTMMLCARLGWEGEQLRQAQMGALLHDIGKIGVPDAILRKPSRLDAEEYLEMKKHPEIGAQILSGVEALVPAVPFVIAHHERWDGNGYPYRLAGEAIPLEGRILAIVDAFDAMTSSRPYRRPLTPASAVQEIEAHAGTQFDPALVPHFVGLYGEGAVAEVLASETPLGIHAD